MVLLDPVEFDAMGKMGPEESGKLGTLANEKYEHHTSDLDLDGEGASEGSCGLDNEPGNWLW